MLGVRHPQLHRLSEPRTSAGARHLKARGGGFGGCLGLGCFGNAHEEGCVAVKEFDLLRRRGVRELRSSYLGRVAQTNNRKSTLADRHQ